MGNEKPGGEKGAEIKQGQEYRTGQDRTGRTERVRKEQGRVLDRG